MVLFQKNLGQEENMQFSLSKEEKLFLYFKYKKSKLPNELITERFKEINSNNHKLTIEKNRIKKHTKKDIMELLS
jgi:hypothetical protein